MLFCYPTGDCLIQAYLPFAQKGCLAHPFTHAPTARARHFPFLPSPTLPFHTCLPLPLPHLATIALVLFPFPCPSCPIHATCHAYHACSLCLPAALPSLCLPCCLPATHAMPYLGMPSGTFGLRRGWAAEGGDRPWINGTISDRMVEVVGGLGGENGFVSCIFKY